MIPRQPYPTDLSDKEWALIQQLVPEAKPGSRPEAYPKREILNATFYLLRGGCSWRMLPHDLPPWRIVYHYFRQWRQYGTWQLMHGLHRGDARVTAGKQRQPSAGIIDRQSVRTTEKGGPRLRHTQTGQGVHKRHILVDTPGLLLAVVVTVASVQNRDGTTELLATLRSKFSRLRLIWADQAYTGDLLSWLWALRPRRKIRLAIVKRPEGT
jgi:putative transposase